MLNKLLNWCTSVVGPCAVVSGDRRFHDRTTVLRLRSESGHHYLKVHRQMAGWAQEVHGYERWASAFRGFAPHLRAIHEEKPLALLVDELPGEIMDKVSLLIQQETAAWQAAGKALSSLHGFAAGACFGPCGRDGTSVEASTGDAEAYIVAQLQRQLDVGMHAGYLSHAEQELIRDAQTLTPAFAGEQPVPCHRDYGPANWLVDDHGAWTGVIDFEFAYWDVRVSDFTRYPNWEWMHRPDLVAAFFDGYGRTLTRQEEIQCRVAHTLYALSAITWGTENAYHGFVAEGRQALRYIGELLSST